MVYLSDKLVSGIKEIIARLDFYEDRVWSHTWNENCRDFLKFCLERNLLHERNVLSEIGVRLLAVGRASYEQHIKSLGLFSDFKVYPDHVSSPQALAYAIQGWEISRTEQAKIRFDHGDTVETFMIEGLDTLPQRIMQQLLEWEDAKHKLTGSTCC